MKMLKAEFTLNDVHVSIERQPNDSVAVRYDGGNRGATNFTSFYDGKAAHAIFFNCHGYRGTMGDVAAIQILLNMF